MAQLVVRNLEEGVRARLQRLADRHGRSIEEEVRDIPGNAMKAEEGDGVGLGSRLRDRFARIGLDKNLPKLPRSKARPVVFGR